MLVRLTVDARWGEGRGGFAEAGTELELPDEAATMLLKAGQAETLDAQRGALVKAEAEIVAAAASLSVDVPPLPVLEAEQF